MKNRIVGFLVVIIAMLMGFMIYSFNTAMADIVAAACSHGPSCPMWGTIDFQTNVSIGIMFFIIAIGIYLIFFGKDERIVTKVKKIRPHANVRKITKEDYRKILGELKRDERQVLERIIESDGTIFQSDLVDKTKMGKVKISRVLDILEGKGLVERRRRGMTNVIILKQ